MPRAAAFAKGMRKRGSALGEAANALGAQAATAIGKSLVQNTPIDEGTAKSNWQLSRVRPRTRTRDAYAKGKFGSTETANETAAIAQIVREAQARQKNQQLFITNNLHYIGKLESSYDDEDVKRKTPPPPAKYKSGFVIIALQNGREVIRNTRLIRQALTGAGVTGFRIEVI